VPGCFGQESIFVNTYGIKYMLPQNIYNVNCKSSSSKLLQFALLIIRRGKFRKKTRKSPDTDIPGSATSVSDSKKKFRIRIQIRPYSISESEIDSSRYRYFRIQFRIRVKIKLLDQVKEKKLYNHSEVFDIGTAVGTVLCHQF